MCEPIHSDQLKFFMLMCLLEFKNRYRWTTNNIYFMYCVMEGYPDWCFKIMEEMDNEYLMWRFIDVFLFDIRL